MLWEVFQNSSHQHNFRFMVVNIPSYFQLAPEEHTRILELYDSIEALMPDHQNMIFGEFFQKQNMTFLDLYDDSAFKQNYTRLYFKEDSHLSPEGDRVVAERTKTSLMSISLFANKVQLQ